MEYCVYILYSASLDKFYVGLTKDIDLRLQYHNHPIEKRKFTARGIPWTLKTTKPCSDKSSAMKLEKYIKGKKSRQFINEVVAGKILLSPDC